MLCGRMSGLLREMPVLVLDCQAGGATPAHGDLLELGWAISGPDGIAGPVRGHWIVPRTSRRVPGPIRELTGWSEACVAEAVPEHEAWAALRGDTEHWLTAPPVPTVIHFARFELTFLRDLHERLGHGAFPFDARCLHAIAERLFPDLPRRNIRALAGFLGHSPELMRRSAGHVEASAFIWRAVVPRLEELGVATWDALTEWLAQPRTVTRSKRRVYPLAPERRRALPDRPGVYRFLRRNNDLLYVGKAASLKKRIAGHFKSSGPTTERGLELLTQVHSIDFTETASILEAALLETDEIKRLDPPYNVALRTGERRAWFSSPDLLDAVCAPDAAHPIGPLPSPRSVTGMAALIALAAGAPRSPGLRAIALSVPRQYLPDDGLFDEGWQLFEQEHLASDLPLSAARRVDRASRALWRLRGRSEPDSGPEDAPPDFWDLARVKRRLERNLVSSGLLLRRARWLSLLADADIAYRERAMSRARGLIVAQGEIRERCDLDAISDVSTLPVRRARSRRERQLAFDAATYDRLRVLTTELLRVRADGGELSLRFGAHNYTGQRLEQLMSAV